MRIDIITALPDLVEVPLKLSVLGRAIEEGFAEVQVHDLRQFATDKHSQIDDYPFGGGAGMVLKPEPIFACVENIESEFGAPDEIIYMTPDGERLHQRMVNEFTRIDHLVLLCGHYKGIDQRVRDVLVTKEVSVGDYVLSGGELPAVLLVDAIVRLIPGALGDSSSALTDSFQDDLLDAPVYTRPASFRGMDVPAVLRSGDHSRIDEWRTEQSLAKTEHRRPDLLEDEDTSGNG